MTILKKCCLTGSRRSLLLLLAHSVSVGRESTALRSLWNLHACGCTRVCRQLQIKALQIKNNHMACSWQALCSALPKEMTLMCRRPQWCRGQGQGGRCGSSHSTGKTHTGRENLWDELSHEAVHYMPLLQRNWNSLCVLYIRGIWITFWMASGEEIAFSFPSSTGFVWRVRLLT